MQQIFIVNAFAANHLGRIPNHAMKCVQHTYICIYMPFV